MARGHQTTWDGRRLQRELEQLSRDVRKLTTFQKWVREDLYPVVVVLAALAGTAPPPEPPAA